MTTQRTGIALGSNLGDRAQNLRLAVQALRGLHTQGEPFLLSPIYQTEPCLCPPGSPDFLNAVVEMAWSGNASELHRHTQSIEHSLGRVRTAQRNAPRAIDIDLLYLGDSTMDTPGLVLPHPRLGERRFVLEPLAAIRPDLRLPGCALTIAEQVRHLPTDGAPLVRFDGSLD